jgi:hypothetical protein
MDVLREHFYWPHMKRDVQRICDRCITYIQAKSRVMPHGLYTHLQLTPIKIKYAIEQP